MDIEIDKGSTQKMSEEIKSKGEELKGEVDKLNNYVEIVSKAWQGEDAEKYKTLMGEFASKLKYMGEVIEEYGRYLSNVPGMYEEIDDVYSTKI